MSLFLLSFQGLFKNFPNIHVIIWTLQIDFLEHKEIHDHYESSIAEF